MLNKKAIAIAVVTAVLLPLSANAYEFMGEEPSNFSYNFVDAAFVDNDFDSGFQFGGSYDVTNSIAVIGSYLTAGDFTQLTIGAAHHAKAGFMEKADLVLHATYESAELDFPNVTVGGFPDIPGFPGSGSPGFTVDGGGFDDTGITVGATLRHQLQDKLEVFGDVSYSTLFDGDILFTGGAEWSFSDQLSVRGSYTLADLDTLSIGARYYFK